MRKQQEVKILAIILLSAFILSGCSLFPQSSNLQSLNNYNANQPGKTGAQTPQAGSMQTGMPQTISEQLAAQSNIKKFEDYDELQDFLEQGTVDSTYSYRSIGAGNLGVQYKEGLALDSAPAPMAEIKAAPSGTGGGGSDDYSTTNIQVEGVDEADIIKTDGKYVYAVVKQDLFIVAAYPAENAEVLTKISFDSRPQDIYINDNYLIIFGRDDAIYNKDSFTRFPRRSSFTFFKVFDISDPNKPKQVRDLNFEGNYFNSRMIGDWVYFVTNNYSWYWYDDIAPIPRVLADGEELSMDCSQTDCYHPNVYYFDIPYETYNFTSINAVSIVDVDEPVKGEVYLLSGNQNMYVSIDNIFITYTKYISEYQLEMEVLKELVRPRLKARDQERIIRIEQVENFILTPSEKIRKITAIIERYISTLDEERQEELEVELEKSMKAKYKDILKELEKTVVHKIAIRAGELEYQTYGEVTGHVLNQFSMDEREGYFRIATTKSRTWSRYEEERQESYNNLYVLDENLKVVGALEGLARDEQIYSVRFMGTRAYMVTFKQTDPLFVIDLSVPTQPTVIGELKIPGFSNYLHPYDDNTLIGLGKDTGETEWGGVRTKGLKLSLFDVSDVSNLKEIDTYIMGDAGSDSIALNDHKAFLFSLDKNLLSLPISIREITGSGYYGDLTFSGAVVFKVSEQGFNLKGKIDHSDGGRPSAIDYWQGYNYYDNTVKRSLYIDNALYTFSNNYLKMNSLDDLALVKTLKLEKEKSGGSDFDIVN